MKFSNRSISGFRCRSFSLNRRYRCEVGKSLKPRQLKRMAPAPHPHVRAESVNIKPTIAIATAVKARQTNQVHERVKYRFLLCSSLFLRLAIVSSTDASYSFSFSRRSEACILWLSITRSAKSCSGFHFPDNLPVHSYVPVQTIVLGLRKKDGTLKVTRKHSLP